MLCEEIDVHLDQNAAIEENPALDCLRKACALFAPNVETKIVICPYCSWQIAELWQRLYAITTYEGKPLKDPADVHVPIDDLYIVTLQFFWMRCPNADCHRPIVLVRLSEHTTSQEPKYGREDVWYAVPNKPVTRSLHALVQGKLREDYLEASAILADSPRMSAVLSRSILADLLKTFAGRSEYNLAARIDKFIEDLQYPSNIKDNLHHLREIADFGAHTQTDQATGDIIEVTPEEAEWTLTVLDGLFDYFIVGPEKNKRRREQFEKKMEAAGRKPIKKPSP